ncbi:MAG: helix-turn-helix domain-containing protein [Candidatus Portnoybacteria bacterium]|nr:helix-turn-helix domain-containing protein [Candidatus Portnoybacteria bacterium]
MKIYKRLSLKEREEISRLLASKWKPAWIAKNLGRDRQIHTEIWLMGGRGNGFE